tara:strand:- start:25 stop:321 length:297 start_codon:yes stop_codon:yes gene_type:complete
MKNDYLLKKPIIEHYGNVGVDSGQLLIIDPCYLEEFMKLYSYEDICEHDGNMKYKLGHEGIACKLHGFGGDGYFNIDSVTHKGEYSPLYSKFLIHLYD